MTRVGATAVRAYVDVAQWVIPIALTLRSLCSLPLRVCLRPLQGASISHSHLPQCRFSLSRGAAGLTAVAYPLVTQGKPILSWPAYFIIMFEMTILFTGLFGFLGVLHHARKPGRLPAQYRTEFSVDRYGVYVEAAAAAEQSGIESLLRDLGAVEAEVIR